MKPNTGWVIIYQPGQMALVHEIREMLPGVGGVAWFAWASIKDAKQFYRAFRKNPDYAVRTDKDGEVVVLSIFPAQWDFNTTAQGFDEWCAAQHYETITGRKFNGN